MKLRTFKLIVPLLLSLVSVRAQTSEAWASLYNYGKSIGIDSTLCALPDSSCLNRYFMEVLYGHVPRGMAYQGVPEHIDSVRIHRLKHLVMTGGSWRPLLDSLESKDAGYRWMKAYCKPCLVAEYSASGLTLDQVYETLNIYRWINRFSSSKHIVVNIPSARLRVMDSLGTTLLDSRVVVGKPSTKTPAFAALIPGLVLYPYWNVPPSITVNELLPKIRRNPTSVLEAMNLQIIDGKGKIVNPSSVDWSQKAFPYRLRQSTGCDNALGLMKFEVSSPYAIYLHDTNNRSVFGRENRFLSHGCIRVEKPVELANVLLGFTRFEPSYMETCPIDAKPQFLSLPRPVPVLMVYSLLDFDEVGVLQVFNDIYRLW
jgi:hypothetical protein